MVKMDTVIPRYLEHAIQKDLDKKMVFLGGPRQCGKTFMAMRIAQSKFNDNWAYLNWDDYEQQTRILRRQWSNDCKLILFDELHKYRLWKRWIKGLYDTTKSQCNYMVTGSARLDVYRKGGDSLLGRYHYWRLHPLTLDEAIPGISKLEVQKRLMTVGGFPEPFLDNSPLEANRWRRERFDRVLKEDLRDIENIQNLPGLILFANLLRERAGQIIELSHIANDIQVAHKTLKRWLVMLESLHLCFTVRSYTKASARALQKSFKVYFYDNADLPENPGQRFENLVATHLLKRCHYLEDATGDRYRLCFVRDKEKREVDFLVLKNERPLELIEAKLSDKEISSSLKYYAERLRPPRAIQLVSELNQGFDSGALSVRSAVEDLARPLSLTWR